MTDTTSGVVTPTGDTRLDISTAADSAALADAGIDTIDTDITDTSNEALAPEKTFADFGVSAAIAEALRDVGITHPFPIQALTLPVALARHDIIGQAKTGTGKTLGFGIPLLQNTVGPDEPGWDELAAPGKPQAAVIVPTRELAVQVAGDLATAARRRSVRIVQVYGGRAYEPQVDALARGAEVVVGTPGRMIDLLKQGILDLSNVRTAVLDEADEMLDLGFLPDVETLLASTSSHRHTMLFSATMPGAVVALARRYMSRPTHIRAQDPDDDGATVKATRQVVYRAHALDKVEVLARILQARGRGLTIVFTRTKRTAARVAEDLAERGFASAAIHGDLGQGAREQALRAFRSGKVDVLVATDVAARGIDVDDVTHVINYQCPEDEKTYLHRVGRTGRAGNTGTAVTFVDWDDLPRWGLISKALGLDRAEPVETYSTSPHLFADLDIPEGTKGRLPRSARTRAGLSAEAVEDLGETGKSAGRGRGEARSGGARDGGRSGGGREGGGREGGRSGSSRSGSAREGAPDSGPREGAPDGAAGEERPRRARSRRRTRSGVRGDQPQA
ncbi:DEAD/DEAH box helicase [Georgenia faecalis]|uniref:DEAD/DEAH box helicase n=1 Tax=Georgenia faecalis TaxID=2483799 RepID=UPI000FD88DAB|nr:DEAD/DEAH box helicase [Georgenia faecalis]